LLTVSHINWGAVTSVPAGSPQAMLGALIFAATGFGLGWVNSGADYSRYLPRSASSRAGVAGPPFGAPVAARFGVVLAHLLLRKPDYAEADLYNPRGRYGAINWVAVGTTLVATFLG